MFAVHKYSNFTSYIKRISERCLSSSTALASSVVPENRFKNYEIKNEPIYTYLKNSKERKELEAQLKTQSTKIEDIPIVIGEKEYRTDELRYQVMPHNHKQKIAKFYYADSKLVQEAIKTSVATQKIWDKTTFDERIKIWERAADLMAGKYRQELNVATMLGQAKTVIQAEIDSACELIDFIRMNAYYVKEAVKYQPISENKSITKNSMRYRGMEGFIAAISPFNFTAIGGNLAYTPALMGCSVLWKPSDTAVLSNWIIFKIMLEAGLPPGVVNFIPCDGPVFGDTITKSEHLGGINFTGSVPTFNRLWRQVGENVNSYNNFPRLIGECGGKNYHFIHPSAEVDSVINGTIRSAFEFCGQKCSACSRIYIPESLWPKIKDGLVKKQATLKVDDVSNFGAFMSAVIDDKAFARIKSYIDYAKANKNNNLQIIAGGKCDDSKGYFVEPTIIQTTDPLDKLMTEEIFGPVLTVYVYKDSDLDKTMKLVDTSTRFALTGAVFSSDKKFLKRAFDEFKMTAGNFYLNDKSTGSVVGQQPFGGARMSGTNDKAGGPHYILRWSTPQSIKETFVPLTDIEYPYMKE